MARTIVISRMLQRAALLSGPAHETLRPCIPSALQQLVYSHIRLTSFSCGGPSIRRLWFLLLQVQVCVINSSPPSPPFCPPPPPKIETRFDQLVTTVSLAGRLYLKEAHISPPPVIDGLVPIPHNGHPLPQPIGGAIAGEGEQQSVLGMSHILELIQLQHQTSSLQLSGSAAGNMYLLTQEIK